ncbi:glycosyltransferase [Nocardia wallacei]|uniref:glycosyltransferase n=1 Tax=Nocardia wallacei TaxID=480035 RepID=UPI002453AD9C|nr:nucleotide disphospho-sugar-binding domain-containing protein [Nocardia wallacei]
MGVLFVPYSAWGHVLPTLAVVAELTGRGVPVRVVAGEEFRSAIESTGAQAVVPAVGHEVRVPAGGSPTELCDRAALWWRRRAAWQATRQVLERELRRERPALCVVDPHVPWAERLVARHDVEVVPLWTSHARSARDSGLVLANTLPELQPGGPRFGRSVHLVGPLVGPAPRTVAAESEPLHSDGPTIVVALGTVFARAARFFRSIVEAFAHTRWTVIVATSWLPVCELGALPPNVYAQQWIPQQEALRTAQVFLTHAGINSVHDAILAGVPMILAPRIREQRLTAARLGRLGIAMPLGDRRELVENAARLASDPLVHRRLREMRTRAESSRGDVRAADLLMARMGGR